MASSGLSKAAGPFALLLAGGIFLSACAPGAGFGEGSDAGGRAGLAPVTHLGLSLDSPAGGLIVKKGDSVAAIARRYRLSNRDIIDLNGLAPPYHLAENQRLLLPPPREHKVGARDTASMLARMYGVSLAELVRLNRLEPPYLLREGQVIRLPAQSEDVTTVAVARELMPKRPPSSRPSSSPLPQAASSSGLPASKRPAAAAKVPDRPLTRRAVSAPKPVPGQMAWPVRGHVISSYGPKADGLYNEGINIAAARGTPVLAARDGTVVYVGSGLRSYGNLVLIRHGEGLVTAYAHLGESAVSKGSFVKSGQKIGTVGTTGTVAQPQLHFEVRQGGRSFDPMRYLPGA